MIPQPLELFYSYSHKDEELRDQLEEHLSMLKREGVIKGWHDRRISGGREWEGQIDRHLNSADIILLLTSSAFLASDYCYDIEVKRAMERHEKDEARVIPVILRACDWHSAPFGKLQAFPKDGKPIKQWPDPDIAFLDIAKGIRRVAEEMKTTETPEEEREPDPIKLDPHLLIPNLRVNFVPRLDTTGNDIVKLLQDELSPLRPRLVALWGAGGVGKTAIAAEAVRGLIEKFGRRVAWVSADGLEAFGLSTLLDEIATQLGHPDIRKLSPELKRDQVRDLVRSASTLVVLDNFETIEATERTRCVDWLSKPTPCSALITTRDGIEGVARNIPIEAMRSEEANALLDELICQAHDRTAFTRLDRYRLIETAEGNPLVLQWIVGQIDLAQDPDEVLDELRHGEGSAAERVFNRSFELAQLNNGGRAVLLALSLFAPSATRKAVAEVSGLGKDSDKKKFKASVRSLSALWLIHTAEVSHRLAVAGLTRQLTKIRLDADPRANTFRPRFTARFLVYGETHSGKSPDDYDALETEKDNLLAAVDVAFNRADWKTVSRLARILATAPDGLFVVRGFWDLAVQTCDRALKIGRLARQPGPIAEWSQNLAIMHQRRGELEAARQLYEESLRISRELGNQGSIASVYYALGSLEFARGRLSEAKRLFTDGLEITETIKNKGGTAMCMVGLCSIAVIRGEPSEAQKVSEDALKIYQDLGDQNGVVVSLQISAKLAYDRGDFSEAKRLCGEALQITQKLGAQSLLASTLVQLGRLAHDQKDFDEAHRLYNRGLGIERNLGEQSGIASALHELGTLQIDKKEYESAERFLVESLSIRQRMDERVERTGCVESIGKLRFAQGRLPQAKQLYNEALKTAQQIGFIFRTASLSVCLARLSEAEGDNESASQMLRQALTIFDRLGSWKARETREFLARIEERTETALSTNSS